MNPFPSLFDNPILVREIRRRMRGKALVYSMIGYICIVTLVAAMIMLVMTPRVSVQAGGIGLDQEFLTKMVNCGSTMFRWITGLQILLVLFIAPTITAGMTTAEKERKTFEFLRVTTIRPWAYILGSFLSTVFYVMLALLCALPPLCLVFLYGGVAPSDVVGAFLLLLAGSLVLSAFGLYISSVRERTRSAQGVVGIGLLTLLFLGLTSGRALGRFLGWGGFGAGTGGGGGLFLFGVAIPPWFLIAFAVAFLTVLFLLLAARKLYRSDERAFTYWQFALLFALSMLVMLGLASGQTVGEDKVLAFASVSSLFLAMAAVCYGVGYLEVGDEMWGLKRRFRFLRSVDDTLFFLAAFGGAWLVGARLWFRLPVATVAIAEYLDALVWVGLSSFVFFVFLGRLLTTIFVTRHLAGRWAMGTMLFFWAILPGMGYFLSLMNPALAPAREVLWRFSPIFLSLEFLDSLGAGGTSFYIHLKGMAAPGLLQAVVYLGLAVAVASVGETRRWRYMRGIDFHFDMPGK